MPSGYDSSNRPPMSGGANTSSYQYHGSSGSGLGAAAGTAIGSIWGPVGGAVGGAIGGAVDSMSGPKNVYATGEYKRGIREQRKNYLWDQNNRAEIQGIVKDANKAGIHPLFALGANVSGGAQLNTGQAAQIAGQSKRGSFATDGASNIAQYYEGKASRQHELDLVRAQAELSRARLLEHRLSNDTTQAAVSELPRVNEPTGNPKQREVITTLFGQLDLADQGQTNMEDLESAIGEAADVEGVARVARAIWKRSNSTGWMRSLHNRTRKLIKMHKAGTKRDRLNRLNLILETADKLAPDVRRRKYQ